MKIILSIVFLLSVFSANATEFQALRSCYTREMSDLSSEMVDTELFVVVDQTTVFNIGLKQAIADNLRPFIRSGNAISVLQFSAFTQGHYTDVLASLKLDGLLSQAERNAVSKPILNRFDRCISNQPSQASAIIGMALKSVFVGSSNGIEKSDVIASLKDISTKVARSKAKRKIVLIGSDMLENSSISSFYSKQAVREINPDAEMALIKQNSMIGNFGNAEIYVVGAGLLAEDVSQNKAVYRSPQVMNALRTFWSDWFTKSNATLVDFGQPALLNHIK